MIDILVNLFGGKAQHSAVLNATHMKKREFNEAVDSLLERDAIVCETGERQANHTCPKMVVVNPEIMESWNVSEQVQLAVLSKSIIYNEPADEE